MTAPFAGLEMKQADRNRIDLPPASRLAAEARAGATPRELGEKYGVGRQRISAALNNAGWNHRGENIAKVKAAPRITNTVAAPILSDELDPPCRGKGDLFTSSFLLDHRRARQLCRECPLALFTACRKLGESESNHDGTYAGVLYVDGVKSSVGRRGRAKAGEL